MPRVQEYRPTAEGMLANSIMEIAESRSIGMLGEACRRAIARISRSPTVGLYLLNEDQPRLIYSYQAPDGFLEDYRRGFGRADPFIDSILDGGGILDGISLYGERYWRGSASYDLLHSWGFAHNMCGPLRCDGSVAGVFYTANRHDAPYTPLMKQQMAMLCRAGSLALTSLAQCGGLNDSDRADADSANLPAVASGNRLATGLPPRSAQVAFLLCKGQTNKTIARQMGISDQTVKEHVTNLCRRFGAQNRTELAALLLGNTALQ
jgi:DNA-binding CsgD family transcriptional regulator